MLCEECDTQTPCADAAFNGHLECLRSALQAGFVWDEETCSSAACEGHLSILKWARTNGCPWDSTTCENAAWAGHLECLQWAHENGCCWDADTCENAARFGHLECLKFAYHHGCPVNDCACDYASMNGHIPCLIFVLTHRGMWSEMYLREDLWDIDVSRYTEELKWVVDYVEERGYDWTYLRRRIHQYEQRRDDAVIFIQKMWRQCWYNPDMQLCQKRLAQQSASWTSQLFSRSQV